ncbi:dipeptidase, partial [Streptococcus pyogenes]
MRPNKPQEIAAIQWMAYGSMPFNKVSTCSRSSSIPSIAKLP